jgi:uncharacterized protein (DUF58 family)
VPSGRGAIVAAAGLGLWFAARIAGSPTLHIVAVGLVMLPIAAVVFTRWTRHRLHIVRRLSDQRIAPGQRVTVDLEIENQGPTSTSFLLIEDRVPPALGRPARLVMTGVLPHGKAHASYTLLAQVRGRYVLGPLTADLSDPFALTKLRIELDAREEVIVTPEIEELGGGADSPFGAASGLSLAKQLFRTGDEFYTMRPYQEGDDLRRIHWRSVARSGELMIRQEESTRRSKAVVFLDTRQNALGATRSPAFERAVSAAASIGKLLSRYGFAIRLGTATLPASLVSEDSLLDTLAGASHDNVRSLSAALGRVRSSASPESTFVAITAPPPPEELATLTRAGSVFGPKLAVLIYPVDPATLPPDRQAQLEGRASSARLSLSRSGWEVLVLEPNARLREVWQRNRMMLPAGSA